MTDESSWKKEETIELVQETVLGPQKEKTCPWKTKIKDAKNAWMAIVFFEIIDKHDLLDIWMKFFYHSDWNLQFATTIVTVCNISVNLRIRRKICLVAHWSQL